MKNHKGNIPSNQAKTGNNTAAVTPCVRPVVRAIRTRQALTAEPIKNILIGVGTGIIKRIPCNTTAKAKSIAPRTKLCNLPSFMEITSTEKPFALL